MNDGNLESIAEKLAGNVAKTPSDDGEIHVKLSGFYYHKYNVYSINYRVNGSVCTLNLADVVLKSNGIFPECREPHRLAIVELDRVLKTHYKMEELLREVLPFAGLELAGKIKGILAIMGDEK